MGDGRKGWVMRAQRAWRGYIMWEALGEPEAEGRPPEGRADEGSRGAMETERPMTSGSKSTPSKQLTSTAPPTVEFELEFEFGFEFELGLVERAAPAPAAARVAVVSASTGK